MLPAARLVDAVRAFEATFPTVRLRLHVEALSAVAQLVKSGGADIGIGGATHITEPGLEQIHVGEVTMIPVAAPGHPLARGNPNRPGAARQHRQLILTVRSPFAEGRDIGVFSADEWRLADLGAKHALLLAGTGWGNMPEPSVRADLAAGRLVRLKLPEVLSGSYALRAIYRTDSAPGPAAAWLIERFAHQVKGRPSLRTRQRHLHGLICTPPLRQCLSSILGSLWPKKSIVDSFQFLARLMRRSLFD